MRLILTPAFSAKRSIALSVQLEYEYAMPSPDAVFRRRDYSLYPCYLQDMIERVMRICDRYMGPADSALPQENDEDYKTVPSIETAA